MDVTNTAHMVQGKVPDNPLLLLEVRALFGIAEAAKQGRVRLCDSPELQLELQGGRKFSAGSLGDAWRDVKFERIESPICYSHTRPWSSYESKTWLRDHWDLFRKDLLAWSAKGVHPMVQQLPSLSDHERESLRDVKRFGMLVACVGADKEVDAFHLWTCLRAGDVTFVSTDKRFRNAVRHGLPDLGWKVISPMEACETFAIEPMDPPLKDGLLATWLD